MLQDATCETGTMRVVLARLAVAPFEAAIAALLVISGLAALAGTGIIDPVTALLPGWEAAGLSVTTTVTGALMIAGAASGQKGPETAGLLFLIAVILCRFLLYGAYLGYGADFAVTGVFDSSIIWAAAARLTVIRRGQVIVRVSGQL